MCSFQRGHAAMDGLPTFPCPVCGTEKDVLSLVNQRGDFRTCTCSICGKFEINGTTVSILTGWGSDRIRLRAGLSAFIRQSNKSGITPQLTEYSKLAEIGDSCCHTSVPAKLRRV